MKANDTRVRSYGKFKPTMKSVSASGTSFTALSLRPGIEETVISYRGLRSKNKLTFTKKSDRPGKKDVRIRVTEPNEFSLNKTFRGRAMSGFLHIPGYTKAQDITRTGEVLEVLFGQTSEAFINGRVKKDVKSLYSAAVNEAYEKANNPRISGATQIVEGIESARMLVDMATGCISYLRKEYTKYLWGKKIQISDATPSTLTDFWLQVRYGFLPLYLSVMDVIHGMTKPVDKPLIYTGSSFVEEKGETVHSVTTGGKFYATTRTSSVYRANCTLYVTQKRDEQPFGFGPYDMLLAAWEKVPLSFVVDWFIGIGSWLKAWRPGGVEVKWSTVTVVQDHVATVISGASQGTYPGAKWYSDILTKRRSFVDRITPITATLLPAWEYESLQWFRQIDALALAYGIITGSLTKAMKWY